MVHDAVARAPQCLIVRTMGTRHNNPKESCVRIYQGKRKKKQSKWFFLSYWGEGAISQSQGKMMARDAVARAPSQCLSMRTMGRHNNKLELIFIFIFLHQHVTISNPKSFR